MRRDGSLEHENGLRSFTLGFTQSMSTFDVIDVGFGKERADQKLKGPVLQAASWRWRRIYRSFTDIHTCENTDSARWHLRNPNCKQVFLGISHDAGYAPYLDDLLQDQEVRGRVKVLEGLPMVRELQATGVATLRLTDSLFRFEKLVDRMNLPVPLSVVTDVSKTGSLPVSPATSTILGPLPGSATYARATGAARPPALTLHPQPRAVVSPAKPHLWDRPDPPIRATASARESIRQRNNNRLCNSYFLRGFCKKRNDCPFDHEKKLTEDEINALALLARLHPCYYGQNCVRGLFPRPSCKPLFLPPALLSKCHRFNPACTLVSKH